MPMSNQNTYQNGNNGQPYQGLDANGRPYYTGYDERGIPYYTGYDDRGQPYYVSYDEYGRQYYMGYDENGNQFTSYADAPQQGAAQASSGSSSTGSGSGAGAGSASGAPRKRRSASGNAAGRTRSFLIIGFLIGRKQADARYASQINAQSASAYTAELDISEQEVTIQAEEKDTITGEM